MEDESSMPFFILGLLLPLACILLLVLCFVGWRSLQQWNERAVSRLSAEERAPPAAELLRHSIIEHELPSRAERHAALASERASASSNSTRNSAASSSAAAASSSIPPSPTLSAATLSIRKHEARLADLRSTFAQQRSWPASSPADQPWSTGVHQRRKDGAGSKAPRREPSPHRSAFVEEITSEDERREAEEAEEEAAAAAALLAQDEAFNSGIVDEKTVLRAGSNLMALLRWDSSRRCVASAVDPSSPSYAALHRSLCIFASLLSRLPYSDLNDWSSSICHVFIDDDGLDKLKWLMQQAPPASTAAPVDIEAAEMAQEIRQAAELILHTLVPFVWSA